MKIRTNKPLFFVFTCVKDGEKYIPKLFESMLSQTKINFVHYIYEDGSEKPLGKLMEEYKKRVSELDQPYKVIYEYNPINIGLNKSTQHCISKCTCPYFIWIDCDNYIDASFFEEMERLYRRNKKAIMLRSFLLGKKEGQDELSYDKSKFATAKNKYQLGIYIRERYFYSFFAVNYQKYKTINPNNVFVSNREFYNDEQVISLCLLVQSYAPITKKAIGYFTTHDGQESSLYKINNHQRKEFHLSLCGLIDNNLKEKIEAAYHIKDLYTKLDFTSHNNLADSLKTIKQIRFLSKTFNISLKNYYNNNLLKYYLKSYYHHLFNK